jgi:hypothetical protein
MYNDRPVSATRLVKLLSIFILVFATLSNAEAARRNSHSKSKNKTHSHDSAEVRRIKAGYAGGWLSKREATQMLKEQRKVEAYSKKIDRSAKLLAYEKQQLKRMRDQTNRKLYKQKSHDRSDRQIASRKGQRSKSRYSRNAKQSKYARSQSKNKSQRRQGYHSEEQALVSD